MWIFKSTSGNDRCAFFRLAALSIICSWSCHSLNTETSSMEQKETGIRSRLHGIPTRTSRFIKNFSAVRNAYSDSIRRKKRSFERSVFPHECSITSGKHFSHTSTPLIYECLPQVLRNPVRDDKPADPDIVPPEETAKNPFTTISTKYYPTTHEATSQADLYGRLRNASFQYDVPIAVTTLRLWYQRIASIEGRAFEDLKRMRVLNLQHNDIFYVAVEAFYGLFQLKELDLSYNRLRSVPNSAFAELQNLKRLSLKHNELSMVQNAAFCGLTSLSTLDLSHNDIGDIGPHALRHFKSAYTVVIRVGHNELKHPREEWLMRGPKGGIDPVCKPALSSEEPVVVADHVNEPPISRRRNVGGMEIEVKSKCDQEEPLAKVILAPVRILTGTGNPWQCVCDSKFSLVRFLRLYRSVIAADYNGGSVMDGSEYLRKYRINSTSGSFPVMEEENVNRTDPSEYFKWYFTMPCDVENKLFTGVDLGQLSSRNYSAIETSCCTFLPDSDSGKKILEKDGSLGKFCGTEEKTNSGELTENHITIIGIVIVFSTPILLTLCPDCNRTVAPSSGGTMMGGGKFGAMSVNNNNNKIDRFSWKSNGRTPFDNDRFCLVLQSQKKQSRTFYSKEVV